MYIADLHIHSRYSRATSRDLTPEQLDFQARKKGIQLLGTGDFTHPAWREELKEKLIPAEDGLYRLREDCVLSPEAGAEEERTRFVVSGEISSIYKQDGKVRKVHSLILLPGLEEAEKLSARLEISIQTGGRFWACPAMICWRLCWRPARRACLFPPTSGRRIFPCSALFLALTGRRSALGS